MRAMLPPSLIALVLIALGLQNVRPQAPIVTAQHPQTLPGSDLKAADLILQADAIIVAKLIKIGTETTSGSQLTMHENQAQEIQFLRGGTQSPLEIDIPINLAKSEIKPATETSYIFFLAKNHIRPSAWAMDPYDAIKLLSATDTNIAEVKRLITLPKNYHQLSGSRMKMSDAISKSNSIFAGTVINIGAADLGPPGVTEYNGVSVRISRLFRGPVANPLMIDLNVIFDPHEDPPKAGQSYLFFVDRGSVNIETNKLLPATKENIAQVEKMLPALPTQNTSPICDDLDLQDALVTADAIFEGQFNTSGTPDQSDLFSFAFPTPHLCNVGIKTSHVFRGTVPNQTTATVFINNQSPASSLSGTYIFYSRNGNPGDKDPWTILKALPATDEIRLLVTNSILPPTDSVLCGSTIKPEEVLGRADAILIGEEIKSVQPTLFSVKVFKVVRGLVSKGNIWINQSVDSSNHETLVPEGSSCIFFLGKTDPYNTNHFSVLKAMPASQENIEQIGKLAAEIPGPKGPEDYNDGKIKIHIAPDANND